MFSSFSKSEEVAIILDISSGYIEGGIVQLGKNTEPYVIWSRKVSIAGGENREIRRIKLLMLKALEEVMKALSKEGISHLKVTRFAHHRIRNIYCVFSSPWYISETRIIRINKEKPLLITAGLLDKLIKEEKAIFEKSLNQGDYAKNFKDQVEILESKVVRIRLNDYETMKPIGKSAQNVEVAIYLSMAGIELTSKIKETIRKYITPRSIHFHSFPLVLFSGVRDLPQIPPHFLLVDVREEVTDISLIKKGLLLETVTIPFGSHFLIREIAASLNTLPQVALSFLRLYIQNKAKPEAAQKIKRILETKKDWVENFHHSLKSFCEEFFVPKTVYLSGDSDFVPLFSQMIQNEVFEQFASDKDPFTVVPVGGLLVKESSKVLPEDTASLLPIESIFVEKITSL